MSTATQPADTASPAVETPEQDEALPLTPVLIAGGVMLLVCLAAVLGLRELDRRKQAAQQRAQAAAEIARTTSRARNVHMGDFPDFSLTDHREQTIDNAALEGRVWVLQFFFACCDKSCPIMVEQMAALQQKHEGAELRFVSITVDPDRDDPQALAKHAKRFAELAGVEDIRRWHLLTGKREAIVELLEQCNLPVSPTALTDDGSLGHVDKFFLVDAGGVIRGIYQYDDEQQMAELDLDLRSLASQAAAR